MNPLRTAVTGLSLLAAALTLPAQSAAPIPHLDPNQIAGTYYTIARYPIKRQKACLGTELVLYALGDKKDSFLIVTTCREKNDNTNGWNASGKLSKTGDGRIRLGWIWPFTKPYWILSLAPDSSSALVGTPNHKFLWILSRNPTLPDATFTQLEAAASAQGYNPARLIKIPQPPHTHRRCRSHPTRAKSSRTKTFHAMMQSLAPAPFNPP